MWQLGKDNWIHYGWGSELDAKWKNDTNLRIKYHVDINPSLNALDEAIRTVNEIVDTYPAPYTLMCSGGVDSQAMIYAWLKSGKSFSIVSMIYEINGKSFNSHDHVELERFSKDHGLNVEYRTFDIVDFLENNLPSISKKYDCDSPQICTYIQMSQQITDGTILFSGNFLDHGYSAALNFTLLGLHRYAEIENTSRRKVIPFFFAHDKNLAVSFISKFRESKKEKMYQINGFPVIPQKQKFNGFELVKEYYDQFESRVDNKSRLRFANYPSNRVFDFLFRYSLYTGNGKSTPRVLEFLVQN